MCPKNQDTLRSDGAYALGRKHTGQFSMKIGIIGTGRMARSMVSTITNHPIAKLAGVASHSIERARQFAQDFGIETATSEIELLDNKAIDAVYIANDSVRHAGSTIAALRAGKAVLCEKPFAVS